MPIITNFTIEHFNKVEHRYNALAEAREKVLDGGLIGRAIAKMQPDLMQKYQEYKAEYEMMLPYVKARADEIAKDFGHVEKEQELDSVESWKFKDGLCVVAYFRAVDGGAKLDTFHAKAEWFHSDYYKEEAARKRAQFEAWDYEEYLRLKKKFEGSETSNTSKN